MYLIEKLLWKPKVHRPDSKENILKIRELTGKVCPLANSDRIKKHLQK